MERAGITPVCRVAKKCGACQLSNMDYTRQLNFKQANAVKILRRFGHVNKIIGMAYPYNYRNKVQMAVRRAKNGNTITGVYQSSTGGIAVTDECFINDFKANKIISSIRKLLISLKIQPYSYETQRGTVRHIMVRSGFATNEYMVVLVCAEDNTQGLKTLTEKLVFKHPEIKTVVLNINKSPKMMLGAYEKVLYGEGNIEDVLCGKRFVISPRSFYQVNPTQTEVLYTTAIDFAQLTGKEIILDAYCGIGTIGIAASDYVKEVVGVEINSDAVNDAIINAEINGLKNARYHKAKAEDFMMQAAKDGKYFDVVFVDPPRAGCNRIFLQSLVTLAPEKIIYVSCNPQTLARDLYYLVHNGYKTEKIQPVDMFPHTNHTECVVSIKKR